MSEIVEISKTVPAKTAPVHKGSMDPAGVYYEAGSGAYFVDVGEHYRRYSRRSPVINGLARHFEKLGHGKDAKLMADERLVDVELNSAVDWAGPLAGHKRGLERHALGHLLITTEPNLPEPRPGEFPFINEVIAQLLGQEMLEQVSVLWGWMKGALAAVQAGVHQPAPLLAVAGPPNCGKSLLAWIVAQLLGGRIGHPHSAWTGSMLWNDDLVGAELLLVDDAVGSSDYRSRINFGTHFKESIYGSEVQLKKRHTSSISVRPVWRAMACVNDDPAALEVLPPVVEGMTDKLILLAAQPVELKEDTSTPEGREKVQKIIRSELPALAHYLEGMEIPEELRDSRGGVTAWRHPELIEALEGLSPAQQLRELLLMAFDHGLLGSPMDWPVVETAAVVLSKLTAHDAPTASQARTLVRGAKQAGRYLAELARQNPELVVKLPPHIGVQRYQINEPRERRNRRT